MWPCTTTIKPDHFRTTLLGAVTLWGSVVDVGSSQLTIGTAGVDSNDGCCLVRLQLKGNRQYVCRGDNGVLPVNRLGVDSIG